jgi:hypothetical protein
MAVKLPLDTGSFYFSCAGLGAWWSSPAVYRVENLGDGVRAFALRDNNGSCLQAGGGVKDCFKISSPDDD